jgi:hypothetical protein
MNRNTRLFAVALVATWTLLAAACRRSEPAATSTPAPAPAPAAPAPVPEAVATLGSTIDAQNRVTEPTERFRPEQTIYVSVATSQTPAGSTLSARWLDSDGTLINESTQTVVSAAGAATEFHISKPDGWPTGQYRVELSLNGQPLTTKTFAVVAGA